MEKLTHLKFNDPAPDVDLQTVSGNTIQLSTLWADSVLLLAFTRHFGCPQCKEMVDQLVENRSLFEAKGMRLVIVTQASIEQARVFRDERAPGLECLCDPERKAYSVYGLGTGTIFQTLLSRRVWRSNKEIEEKKGWKPELPPPGQDAFLMSGTFIIGMDGLIRMPYYYDDIADHPSMDLLLKGIMGMDWKKPLEGPITPQEGEAD
jgi:peroxiredoxin